MMGDLAPHGPQRHRVESAWVTPMGELGRIAAECGWRRLPGRQVRPTWRREWTDQAGVEWRQHLTVDSEPGRAHIPARLTVARWCDTEDPVYDFQWDLPTALDVYDAAVAVLRAEP